MVKIGLWKKYPPLAPSPQKNGREKSAIQPRGKLGTARAR